MDIYPCRAKYACSIKVGGSNNNSASSDTIGGGDNNNSLGSGESSFIPYNWTLTAGAQQLTEHLRKLKRTLGSKHALEKPMVAKVSAAPARRVLSWEALLGYYQSDNQTDHGNHMDATASDEPSPVFLSTKLTVSATYATEQEAREGTTPPVALEASFRVKHDEHGGDIRMLTCAWSVYNALAKFQDVIENECE